MSKSHKSASSVALLLVALFTLTLAGLTLGGGQAMAEGSAGDPGGESETQPDTTLTPEPMMHPTGVPMIVYLSVLTDAIL
jgi:hypothetical protein